MKRLISNLILISILFSGIISCVKQAPQIPSNKGNTIDSSAVSLLVINKRLAIQEDELIRNYVAEKASDFKKNDLGFWYKINSSGSSTRLKQFENYHIHYQLFLLNGKQILSESKVLVLGKKQVITGLDEGLKMLHKGDSATFIIPWYLAYGMKGNEKDVPPYTTLIYRVKVEE